MLRYVGDGAFLPGVPARDLTDDEAARYSARYGDEKWLVESGLYIHQGETNGRKLVEQKPRRERLTQ